MTPEAAVAPDWRPVLARFEASPEGVRLAAFLAAQPAAGVRIFPPEPLRALRLTPPAAPAPAAKVAAPAVAPPVAEPLRQAG